MRTKTPVSVKDIKTILRLSKKGLSSREIGRIIGRSHMTAYRVVKSYPQGAIQANPKYVTVKE